MFISFIEFLKKIPLQSVAFKKKKIIIKITVMIVMIMIIIIIILNRKKRKKRKKALKLLNAWIIKDSKKPRICW